MALAQLVVFPRLFGHRAAVDTAEFWLGLQLGMVAGFTTAVPVNAWLIHAGLKERM